MIVAGSKLRRTKQPSTVTADPVGDFGSKRLVHLGTVDADEPNPLASVKLERVAVDYPHHWPAIGAPPQ